MTDIEQARAVLAKWKDEVGTAGNPELLDAIDQMLADSKYFQFAVLVPFAESIAAAILAADQRINA